MEVFAVYAVRPKGRHLSQNDRNKIEFLFDRGISQKEIAAAVGVHPSTICRELRRAKITLLNSDLTTRIAYSATIAQQKADFAQTSKGRPLKIGHNYAYLETLQQHILNHHSPYAAIQKERRNTAFSVSAPTLYRYIQMGLFTQITYSHLPRAKKKKRKGKIHRQNKTNLNHRSIEIRCKAIMHRSDFGHWELDSVIGKSKGHGQSVLVLTERKTRIEIILRPKDKTAAETARCLRYLKRIFGRDYNKIFKTITCDNGSEFADQQAFERVGSMFFYCHPSCPSERGSNENANILIRRKLPKGQSMKNVTQKQATQIQHWLNDYPRHIFNGKTAFEMLMQELPAMNLHNPKRIVNFFDPHP